MIPIDEAAHDPAPLIGFGAVWHARLRPVAHRFRYRGFFVLLPLRTLARAPERAGALRRNRAGWLSFHDRDHGFGGNDALAWIDALLRTEGIDDADGETWLQTYPRVLGYAFKPVSFWYAHRADGSLAAIVAEVNNTFGERHCYLLHGAQLAWDRDIDADKVFHVSPFCSVEGRYRFRFRRLASSPRAADGGLSVTVDLIDRDGPLLRTGISGDLRPLDRRAAWRALLGMPLMTFAVSARILWQAARLALRRVPIRAKPAAPGRFVTR